MPTTKPTFTPMTTGNYQSSESSKMPFRSRRGGDPQAMLAPGLAGLSQRGGRVAPYFCQRRMIMRQGGQFIHEASGQKIKRNLFKLFCGGSKRGS
jgi:hypothetical protein